MPGKHRHTAKQDRQARHVADSERKRGMDPKQAESIGWATVNKDKKKLRKDDGNGVDGAPVGTAYAGMGKSFLTIDEAYDLMRKAAASAGAPKKFPRSVKPTVQMKPISDGEAMANLQAGKHTEGTEKALQTGYGKVSGGGALKAPNRGRKRRGGDVMAQTWRARPSDIALSINDLQRAMEAMPTPDKVGPPKVYLPGVHNPKSPVRSKPKSKKSMRPSVVSDDSPRAVDGGGAALLSAAIGHPTFSKSLDVVQKSEGDTMSKTNFNDLFKSELGVSDDTLIDCPHCEAPITKSDLAKATSHKGKGAVTHLTGKEHGKSGAHVEEQNPEGGVSRAGSGHGKAPVSRGVPGAKKEDAPHGVQNSKGSKTMKSVADSSSDDASDDKSEADEKPFEKKKDVKKSNVTIRTTGWVSYVDDGEDARIAKSISEGALGGTPPTEPMDLNNDMSRLLI